MNRRAFMKFLAGSVVIGGMPAMLATPAKPEPVIIDRATREFDPSVRYSEYRVISFHEWRAGSIDVMALCRHELEANMHHYIPAPWRHRVEWLELPPKAPDKSDPLGETGVVAWKFMPV